MWANILAKLLGGRRQCIPAARIPKFVRVQLDELRDIGAIALERGVYRVDGASVERLLVSDIALYSSYRLPAPPIPALTGE